MNVLIKNLTVIVFLFTIITSAQKKIWLDGNLNETDQLNSVYYKVVSEDAKEELYFYKNTNIFRKIIHSNEMSIAIFSEFYETGSLKIAGKYEKGLKEGIWKKYYVNGKIKERGRYKNGKKVGIWKTFYKNF